VVYGMVKGKTNSGSTSTALAVPGTTYTGIYYTTVLVLVLVLAGSTVVLLFQQRLLWCVT
jgi:hypothetical protein